MSTIEGAPWLLASEIVLSLPVAQSRKTREKAVTPANSFTMPTLQKPAVPRPPEAAATPLYSPRGAKLATRVWNSIPDGKSPRAVCLMVPGGGWHSGYFEPLASVLNQNGFACASYDPVCMGYSEAEPGTPEGCIHINAFDDYVDDVFAAVAWTKQQLQGSEDLPIFLIGESFGGLQVLVAGLASDRVNTTGIELAGVVVMGAAIAIDPATLPPKPAIKILAFLARYFPRVKMPATDFSATFDDAFGNKAWAEVARRDPGVQVSPRPTMAAATAIVATGEHIARSAEAFGVPLLAIHAVRDCRTMCEAVRQFVDRSGSQSEGFWIEDTTGHQLLQDRDEVTSRVMEKVASWLIDKTEA
ncbi:MAG: alpha/beta fold hydrolase [Cyanobacteria bacterium J06639_1]